MRVSLALSLVVVAVAAGSLASAATSGPAAERTSAQQYGTRTVLVCHRTASRARPFATLSIARTALPRYLRLGATVGPCVHGSVRAGGTVSLRTSTGRAVTSLEAGRVYSIVVSDSARQENFHLRGRGVDRLTGRAFRGTVRWKVRFAPGRYRYRSDAHPRLERSFTTRTPASL